MLDACDPSKITGLPDFVGQLRATAAALAALGHKRLTMEREL